MSYLSMPSLTFTGQFQADTSTVNNDPRHFDNANFEERFQEFQTGGSLNGWWNPSGTGIFRLSNCQVMAYAEEAGAEFVVTGDDEVLSFTVGNSPDRPSAKLVDLDPDWQLASMIYGQSVTLVNPKDGSVVLSGDYEPAPFRDLWFTRGPAAFGGDNRASAMFQSVLSNVKWNLKGVHSPFLKSLREHSKKGMLSIRLTTYGYQGDSSAEDFTYGKLAGAIGPYCADEPRSFVLGRRFQSLDGASSQVTSKASIGCFSSWLNEDKTRLNLDLSNALPLDLHNRLVSVGPLSVVVLKNIEANAVPLEGDQIGSDQYEKLCDLDYSEDLLTYQSGIMSVPVNKKARALIGDNPLALMDPSGGTIVIREQPDGVELRPEVFTFRLDPNDPAQNRQTTTFYAARYGKPLSGAEIIFTPMAPNIDSGSCPADPDPATTPKATCPKLDTPVRALTVKPVKKTTDASGKVNVNVKGPDVMDQPRVYLDGQLFTLTYNFAEPANLTILQQFDVLAVLVFSTFKNPKKIAWSDVEPIMRQYANLYPVMSRGLFDFSQQTVFENNAAILKFVFDKDVLDPDYMPVTRDLSSAKRAMLLTYLDRIIKKQGGPTFDSHKKFASRCPMRPMPEPAPDTAQAVSNSISNSKRRSKS